MKHRIFVLLLSFSALLCVSAQALEDETAEPAPEPAQESAQEPAESDAAAVRFARVREDPPAFADVKPGSWYTSAVETAYAYGLVEGRGGAAFAPEESVTVAELLTLSARLRSSYENGGTSASFAAADGQNWYEPYFAYLREQGLFDDALGTYDVPATRAQMASIFAVSLPAEWYDERNAQIVTDAYISRDFITDVDDYTPYQQQILWMYKQGLLVGMDETGSFAPYETVTRAEIATLLTRLVEPDTRLAPEWVVLSYHSAAGATLASLVEAPETLPAAPDAADSAAIDALVRQMLAADQSTITLSYPSGLNSAAVSFLTHAFSTCAKSYCEQMYNSVTCKASSSGRAYLTFFSTACSNAQLRSYRERTMQRAIEIHDMLWESGALSYGMSEYEIAQTYFAWLCENCRYDGGTITDGSLSHTAYGALCSGVAVCDGYTGAYNLLLKLEGISCYALFNDTHIWTVAYLDGTEYHIDTTWGDQYGHVDMNYFAMTAEQSRAHHAW